MLSFVNAQKITKGNIVRDKFQFKTSISFFEDHGRRQNFIWGGGFQKTLKDKYHSACESLLTFLIRYRNIDARTLYFLRHTSVHVDRNNKLMKSKIIV